MASARRLPMYGIIDTMPTRHARPIGPKLGLGEPFRERSLEELRTLAVFHDHETPPMGREGLSDVANDSRRIARLEW